MKKIIVLITTLSALVVLVGAVIAFDSRYGLATAQQKNTENHETHKLEHREEVIEKRLWSLEQRQAALPTPDRALDIKETESRLEKVKREIDMKLGIKTGSGD